MGIQVAKRPWGLVQNRKASKISYVVLIVYKFGDICY